MQFWKRKRALAMCGAHSSLAGIGVIVGSWLLGACSAAPAELNESGLDRDGNRAQAPANAPFEEPSLEEREARYQEQLHGSLSDSEREALEATLATAGLQENKVEFRGRLIELGGDAYLEADDLLQAQQTVEKGQLLSQVFGDAAPNLYARQVDDHTEFWRPDLNFGYQLIVDDAVPQFVMTALQAAASAIANAGSADCITGSIFTPIRKSAFDKIDPRAQPVLYRVPVVYSSTACEEASAIACSKAPRFERHITQVQPSVTEDRMRFGTRLGIMSGKVTSDTADNRGALIHEMLHLMGVMHPESEQIDVSGLGGATLQKIVVHGTLSGTNYPSIMHSTKANANWRNTLQPDDIKVLLTLYSNYQDGRAPCGYFAGFRTPPLRL